MATFDEEPGEVVEGETVKIPDLKTKKWGKNISYTPEV